MSRANTYTNLPRPLSLGARYIGIVERTSKNTASGYVSTSIEGGVLKIITKSKI